MNAFSGGEQPLVKLKGVGDSLWVTLNPHLPVDILQQELTKLFSTLSHLAINARVVIDPGDSGKHEKLINNLGEFLKENFAVGYVSPPPQKRSETEERVRKRDVEKSWENRKSDVLMLAGRVRSGQKVSAQKHLIVMGDVNPGGEVVAGGDVMVMGSLCGTAIAGQSGDEESIILALDFRPTQIQIGGLMAAGLPASSSKVAEYAHIEDGAIVVDDYLKANPFSRMPWPQVR